MSHIPGHRHLFIYHMQASLTAPIKTFSKLNKDISMQHSLWYCKGFIRVGEEVYIVITILIVKMVVVEFIQAWWMQMQLDWKSATNFNWNLNSALNSFSTFLLSWSLSYAIHGPCKKALNQRVFCSLWIWLTLIVAKLPFARPSFFITYGEMLEFLKAFFNKLWTLNAI